MRSELNEVKAARYNRDVLILILMECARNLVEELRAQARLVLILILMECARNHLNGQPFFRSNRLNPYSNGMRSEQAVC